MPRGQSANTNLLTQFLTEFMVIYLSDAKTTIQSESGELAEIPLIVEGVLWDFDSEYLLIGDDRKVQFSLINRDLIAKIDIVDRTADVMNDPSRPSTEDMN